MAHWLERKFICQQLSLSIWQSYDLFPVSNYYSGLINSDRIVDKVNEYRVRLPEFTSLPELLDENAVGVETAINPKKLILWTRRSKNPIPHVRFSCKTKRFHLPAVEAWLSEKSKRKQKKRENK